MRLAYFAGAVVAVVALQAYFLDGLVMHPDFELYTQGGLGFYPSPLGRALGALGPSLFAVLSSVAAGAVVVLSAARADSSSRATAIACSSPAVLYLLYAGIDPIGLALLLAALVTGRPLLLVLAALAHLSLAPFALLLLPRSTASQKAGLGVVVAVSVGSLLLTPYAGIVYGAFRLDALTAALMGLAAFAVIAAPSVVCNRLDRLTYLSAGIGAAECLVQHHLQARYLLPAAFIAVASPARSWARAPRALRAAGGRAQ